MDVKGREQKHNMIHRMKNLFILRELIVTTNNKYK